MIVFFPHLAQINFSLFKLILIFGVCHCVWVLMGAREEVPELSDAGVTGYCELPMWMEGTELGSSGRAANALQHLFGIDFRIYPLTFDSHIQTQISPSLSLKPLSQSPLPPLTCLGWSRTFEIQVTLLFQPLKFGTICVFTTPGSSINQFLLVLFSFQIALGFESKRMSKYHVWSHKFSQPLQVLTR